MFKNTSLKQASRVAASTRPSFTSSAASRSVAPAFAQRYLHATPALRDEKHDEEQGAGEHSGQFARTDESIQVEYPDEKDMPSSKPVQGRGGFHFKRTLASFSSEGNVGSVTGGARGLGLVMSQAMVISGADVAIVDSNKEEAQKQAELSMQSFRDENPGAESVPKVTAHYADVSNPDSVSAVIQEVIDQHGKIDNSVTSAGFTENFDAINYPYDRIKKSWGVNVDGTYLFATGVAKHSMERDAKGSIVFIGSMSGAIVNVPQPQAPYNAAKAAVRHLAASLAVEWAHKGIRVNCISPGYMLTASTKKILDDNPELAQKWTSLIPQGKMGQPEDLMGAVVFSSSDAAGYVTGAEFRVDGGYTVT